MDVFWRLAGLLALVLANGFFVAAEFSIVTVRKTRIDQLIAEGHTGAQKPLAQTSANSPASNYGAGGYDSRVLTALALQHRSAAGPRLGQTGATGAEGGTDRGLATALGHA